jgi:hypothetical protein
MNFFDFNGFQGCQRVGKIGENNGRKPPFLKISLFAREMRRDAA